MNKLVVQRFSELADKANTILDAKEVDFHSDEGVSYYAVSLHNKSLLGKRGLGRYAWCVAAEVLLCLPPGRLRELAARLREEAEHDPEAFAEKWNDREATAQAVAPELRAALHEALKRVGPGTRRPSTRKS